MDKIKTVKIKNPNGSVSEETYTIAVDARNVDMENGKELQETIGTINIDNDGDISNQLKNLKSNKINKIDIIDNLESNDKNKVLSANQGKEINDKLKKKPYYYNTVVDMKADEKLKNGDMAITLGYYEANDGGAGEYIILDDKTLVEDGGLIHILNNGLRAKLILNKYVTPEIFGAKGNGEEDDSIAFNNALLTKNIIILNSEKTYLLNNPIILNENKNECIIHGNFATILHDKKFIDTSQNLSDVHLELNDLNIIDNDNYPSEHQTIEIFNSKKCLIKNCNFEKNSDGGCIRIRDNSRNIKITNCSFKRTSISSKLGSAIGIWDYDPNKNIENVEVTNCYINWSGADEVITIFNGMTNDSTKGGLIDNIEFNNIKIVSDKAFNVNYLITINGGPNDINVNFNNINVLNTSYINILGSCSQNTGNVNIKLNDCRFINNSLSSYSNVFGTTYGNLSLQNNCNILSSNSYYECTNRIVNVQNTKFNSINDTLKSKAVSTNIPLVLFDKTQINIEVSLFNDTLIGKSGVDNRNRTDENKLIIKNCLINLTGDYFLNNGIGGTLQNENGTIVEIKNNIINMIPSGVTSENTYKHAIIKGRNVNIIDFEDNKINVNNAYGDTYFFYFYYTNTYTFVIETIKNIIVSTTTFLPTNATQIPTNKIDEHNYINFISDELLTKN